MKTKQKNTHKDICSCNLCKRGELSDFGNNLLYPYDTVYELRNDDNTGLSVDICVDCLKEINNFVKSKMTKLPTLFTTKIYSAKKDNCSCNLCKRGVLNSKEISLDYPYDIVIEFRSPNGIIISFCEDCLKVLQKISMDYEAQTKGKRFDL